jgi:hypothetical protein
MVAHRTPPPSEPANRRFLPERDRRDGTLDGVIVELDATVIEEAGEGRPAGERVADGLGEGAGGWNAAKLDLEPRLHHLDERPGAGVTHMRCGPGSNPRSHRVRRSAARPRRRSVSRSLRADRRTCVAREPAGRQSDAARRGQPLEASIAVDLQHTTEVLEMSGRTFCLAIRTVEVDGGRRFGPGPGSIVARIDPQPTGFGAAEAGIEHGDRRVVGE